MPTISAIIITKNEEKHIRDCINTVLWTDEIIVLDCGSTDHTQNICKEYTPKVRLQVTDWPGFGKQKNRALDLATSEWVLSIDADERVTPKLKEEILKTINSNKNFVAYKLPFQNHFLSQPIRYCFGSDYHTRLMKKESCRFSDTCVHEEIITNGKIGKLRQKLYHFPSDNLEETIGKLNSYSTLGALKLYQAAKKTNPMLVIAHACWIFIKFYFLRLGFLDGWPGLVISLSNFEGTFYKYAKLLEKNNEKTKI